MLCFVYIRFGLQVKCLLKLVKSFKSRILIWLISITTVSVLLCMFCYMFNYDSWSDAQKYVENMQEGDVVYISSLRIQEWRDQPQGTFSSSS